MVVHIPPRSHAAGVAASLANQSLQQTGRGAASSTSQLHEPRPAAERHLVRQRMRRARHLLSFAALGLVWATVAACTQPAPVPSESERLYSAFSEKAAGSWLSKRDATSAPASEHSTPSLLVKFSSAEPAHGALGKLSLSEPAGPAEEYVVFFVLPTGLQPPSESIGLLCAQSQDTQGIPQGELITVTWVRSTSNEHLIVQHGLQWPDLKASRQQAPPPESFQRRVPR